MSQEEEGCIPYLTHTQKTSEARASKLKSCGIYR